MSKFNSQTKSTKKSLGLPTDRELDTWNNEGQRRSVLFLKTKIKNQKPNAKKIRQTINNEQQLQFAFNSSINRLREETKSQKSVSSTISNRLSYYQIDLKRKQQRMQIAKSKYHRMIQTRHKSFIEKKQLNNERAQSASIYSQQARLKASRIRSQRKNSQISLHIVHQKNQSDAMVIKEIRFRNQQLIAQRQMMEVEKKRLLVQKSHQYYQISRQKLTDIQNQKYETAKATHKFKMLQQFTKGEMQRRKNTKLIGTFKEKVKKLEQESKKIAKELTQYEKMLGKHYSSRSTKISNTPNTLYVTS